MRTPRVQRSDEVLMAQFCDGDEEAFEELFGRHSGPIRAYLRRATQNEATADDLTQVTFLSMVRGRGRFTSGSLFRPWLYAIATNAARDFLRRNRREAPTDDGELPELEAEAVAARDPALAQALTAALDELPEAQREAIVMNRVEELTFAEIASTAGVTESAVKVRAHRGTAQLRRTLQRVWSAL